MRTIYSHGCELDTPNAISDAKLRDHLRKFFRRCCAPAPKPKTALSVVNGIAIEEVLVNFGEIDFGGKMTAKATLAIWRNRMTQEHLIGEYGFQIKFLHRRSFHGKAQGIVRGLLPEAAGRGAGMDS